MRFSITGVVSVWGAFLLATGCFSGSDPGQDSDAMVDSEGEQPSEDESSGGPGEPEDEEGSSSTTGDEPPVGEEEGSTGEPEDTDGEPEMEDGLVLTLVNAEGPNEVMAFTRGPDGALEEQGTYATGGMGTGGGLGSQSAMAIEGDLLFVVNAGDDTVSSMRIYDDHLALVDVIGTEGSRPTSLTVLDDRLYVLNAQGPGSVVGFGVDEAGQLSPLEGASRALSGHESPAPAQVGISPQGDYLVVTERATNQILTYAVHDDGSLDEAVVNPSEGMTPFGFQFSADGVFVVSEAFGGGANPGASASSSYRVADGGSLWTFSASVPSGQTAACWIEIVRGQYAYATNTGSNTLSAYTLGVEGDLTLFGGGGVVYDFGDEHSPIDMTSSADDQYLYVLNAAADEIAGFAVEGDGALAELGAVAIPETAVGLLGYR